MFSNKKKPIANYSILIVIVVSLWSCGSFINENTKAKPIARVGETFLYQEDVDHLLYDGITVGDSATTVTSFINNWASKQLLLSKAKFNLAEDKLKEFDALVLDYQTDLYTRAYKDALVDQMLDSMITAKQMKLFYEKEKENFRLKERIVKIRFIQLPKRFLNKAEVKESLKRFEKDDIAYLDSIAIQFKKLNFNDSLWITASRVIAEIPVLTPENQDKYLKNSQFFEMEDALGVYLAKVTAVLQVNDIAPLSFIEPMIKQVLMNRRKLDYIRRLETEVIDEAIKRNEFEVYVQKD